MMFEAPFYAFLSALICNLVATPVVIRLLRRFAVLDIPNQRSSHEVPVPRGGGIVIVATWCFGMMMTWALRFPFPALGMLAPNGFVVSMTIAMIALALLGFSDDRCDLPPLLKLAVQVGVAVQALYLSGLRMTELGLPFSPHYDFGLLGWLLSAVWLVGLTNIFNFMDGINGLAFTQLIFGGATFCLLGVLDGDYELAISGALIAGSAVGILKYNFPKALVFMGDVGSLPLGFLLAFMGLRAAFGPDSVADAGGAGSPGHPQFTFLQSILVLWPFLYDGSYTLLNRIWHGRNPFHAHRSHLYQRLLVAGYTHKQITLRYGGAMLVCSLAGLWLPHMSDAAIGVLLLSVLTVSVLFTVKIVRRVAAAETVPGGAPH